jgi:anti-anti-sigma factor
MASTWGVDRTAEGVAVYGELDLACAKQFGEGLAAAVREGSGKSFLIDLSDVTFMDSMGLRALLKVLQLPCGKDLIVQSSPQVFTILHLANLVDGTLPNVEIRPPGGRPPAP